MSFFILRNGLQYGPYSPGDVQHFLRTGELYPGDLGRTEAMKEWLPLIQILGQDIPPLPSSETNLKSRISGRSAGPALAGEMKHATFAPARRHLPPRIVLDAPPPPSLHWGVLLLLVVVTFGLFGFIWSFVIARWAREVDPRNRTMPLLIVSAAFSIGAILLLIIAPPATGILAAVSVGLIGFVLFLFAMFTLRRSILTCGFADENTPPLTTAIMTLLFNVVYLQCMFNHARRSRTHSPTQLDLPRTTAS